MARMAEKPEARREGLGEEEAQCGEAFTYPLSAVLPHPLGLTYTTTVEIYASLPPAASVRLDSGKATSELTSSLVASGAISKY
jgi:hypothetical protein